MDFQQQYDVVVAGGGVAGVAAALAAARRGLKTVLIEKTVWPGGLATTGMICIYLPLCDGCGTQVAFGLTEELLRVGLKYGPGDIPANWRQEQNATEDKRYRTVFSPASFILALDELLEAAGVDIWLDTVITGAHTEHHRLTDVQAVNKSGTGIIAGRCFVDATGDADLAYFAGAPCPTAANAPAFWALEFRRGHDSPFYMADNVIMRLDGANVDANSPDLDGINGRIVSRAVLAGRRKYRHVLEDNYASGKYDRKSLFPLMLPGMAQLRHTRRITGQFTLSDGMAGRSFDDAVGLIGDWRKSGPVWEIPYRSLLPVGVGGMIAAGRCIAAEKDAWEVMRVIPTAALTGEVAGVAAALSVQRGITPDTLPFDVLSRELREQCKFPLHFADVGLKPVAD